MTITKLNDNEVEIKTTEEIITIIKKDDLLKRKSLLETELIYVNSRIALFE